MNILETIILYRNEFGIIYNAVLSYGALYTVTILTPSLLVFGIVRSAYNYAKGNEIKKPTHSMFVLRFIDKLLTLFGGQNETMFRVQNGYDENRERVFVPIPIGSNFAGMVLDVAAFTVLLLMCFLIWPVVAFASVTFGPLHACRVRNLRKKEFIANLKGNETNA